ncbi:hypothetical protein AcV5_003462 [Taiwanofungus camphoratus]|nr:hypothetical protein AcV5_003462 [Antrodia cinnamomea]
MLSSLFCHQFSHMHFLPLDVYLSWANASTDVLMYFAAKDTTLKQAAGEVGEGIVSTLLYPNYAIYGTPLGAMYGSNVGTLGLLTAQYNPRNVMGLAGGWKF